MAGSGTGTRATSPSVVLTPVVQAAISTRGRLRVMIGDNNKLMVQDKFGVGDGNNNYFKISMFPVRSGTEILVKNTTSLTRNTDYTIDNTTGLITMGNAPTDGQVIQALRYEYNAFSDTELDDVLSSYGDDLNMSAAHCCRALATDAARFFSYTSGDEKVDRTKESANFLKMAEAFEAKAIAEQSGQMDIGIQRSEIYDEEEDD